MLKRTIAVVVIVAAAVASGSALAARQGARHHARHRGTTITLHKTPLGKVLATSSGMTLYMYKPDPKGKSVCTGSCSAVWPPLLTKGKPHAGKGLKAKLLGTTHRSNGIQVTYAGHPLYRFSGDSQAGQASGEGYGGIWFVLSASGHEVTGASGSTTTTGGGGGGY